MKKEEKDISKKPVDGIDFVIMCEKGYIVKHFPCWLVKEEDTLTIETVSRNTEETAGHNDKETENYVTFTVETKGGKNAKSKQIIKNKNLECYGPLWIYAKTMENVEQALRNDGRFTDIVFEEKCWLSTRPSSSTVSLNQFAKKLNGRNFEICLTKSRKKTTTKLEKSVSLKETSWNSEGKNTETSLLEPIGNTDLDFRQMARSKPRNEVSDVREQSSKTKKKQLCQPMLDYAEIKKILLNQFDDLVKHMESRSDVGQNTFPEELSLMQENFGKIRQKFSEVHRVKKLTKLGDSVCQVIIKDVETVFGTGFVLFDNFILTNAHLFESPTRKCIENLHLLVDVSVKFNHEDPTGQDLHLFEVKKMLIDMKIGSDKNTVDYAILEIHPQTGKRKKKVPPGLLSVYGHVPASGGACLIGHPGGNVKQMEPTSIIGYENREEAVDKYKRDYGHAIFTINDGINKNKVCFDQVMQKKDNAVTYNTSFLHGSSGSPVFDDLGRVFGIHTGGFEYKDPRNQTTQSVIEYALPLLPILENFILRLKEENMHAVLNRVKEEAQKNLFLFKTLFQSSKTGDEPMDTS
uniref:Serine protease n=1 Tax=Esox lucius TaxID=8010 RepID=A0AAY5KY66_ESOLU